MLARPLYLAAGLQSGGTTLVSWCFLQRADMDGVLDLPHDALQPLPLVETPATWAKLTIACFRFHEVAEFYRWYGCEVRPLLVVRDVRRVYASLRKKWYGMDGTTAEDPPLRLRLSRFLEDWREFRANDWPILRYESLVADPESALRDLCGKLGLAWDDAMLTWPKPVTGIADAGSGNSTFFRSLAQGGAAAALIRSKGEQPPQGIPDNELAWIAEHFGEYNEINGYEPYDRSGGEGVAVYTGPQFEGTRRDQAAKDLQQEREARRLLCNRLSRILGHPVLGRAVRFWARFMNPGFSEVLKDEPIDRSQ